MSKKLLPMSLSALLLGLVSCNRHIDPATAPARTVLMIVPTTDDDESAVAFVEDQPGSVRLTDNQVALFPKKANTVTHLINNQPVTDKKAILNFIRATNSGGCTIKLVENASKTHRTFVYTSR